MVSRSPVPKLPNGKSANKKPAYRHKAKKVKTAKGRKLSSTNWLQRQLNDPYVEAAKNAGYRSRAAFKLLDIEEKFHLFKKGMSIIDLGAAPGGWSQICAESMGFQPGDLQIIATDIQPMDPLPGVTFLCGDFMDPNITTQLTSLANGKVDMVISDMAPFTIGVKAADQIRILNLAEAAIEFSFKTLKKGGHFITKLFEGGGGNALSKLMKMHFKKVHYFKPASSRKDSSEIFLVAIEYKAET